MTMDTSDTHSSVQRLIEIGIEEKEAEELVKLMQEGKKIVLSGSHTKVKQAPTKEDISLFQKDMGNKLLALENKLIYWMIGNSLAIIAILSALVILR